MSEPKELQGIKQGAIFYLKVCVGNADNSMDIVGEAPTVDTDLESVLQCCVEETEGYGLINFVYECRPIRKIVRGKTKIIVLKFKKP